MNWGNKLILVFILFGSGMSYMVYRCMQTPVDLVSANYYRDELAYQQVIDGTRHANALSQSIQLSADGEFVHLQLPIEMKDHSLSGTVRFYCAADASRDQDIPLQPNAAGNQDIPRRLLRPGNYTVSINWKCSSIDYFNQQSLILH